ncbi:hypothetical protein SpiGrapes_2924 [Sphaerochaeta pleomorpha str. Grapes]|uniref:Uncharacterized protein n=1 Tax=Sphaerochaeta pleomorpha (strain ATCC BAA-1885 / DSM 22778 / Grapes) TaxID=158190 RepID=G8QX89_SPHPG|nr:hypothetical protein [Sphaerochaeta pleomorpha]AEV30674.1 hypothetical protein SpiGrapes_2924 [Sphaerochaeta pleomorpha str. Grapes]
MGTKKIKNLFIVATILVILVSFIGCDLSDATLQGAAATSRKLGAVSSQEELASVDTTRTAFTATVNLYQDYANVVTQDMGNSNHHKTIEETLYSYQYGPYGGTIVSDWDLLNGKNVVMTNITNYNLDPVTGEIGGSNHSVINIVDDYGNVILSLDANGNLKGSLFGAEINMNWNAKNSKVSGVKANGKVSGVFVWMGFNPETNEVVQILPNGTFTLTGSYK